MKNNTTLVKATSNNTVTLAQVQLNQVIEQLKQDDSTLLQAYSEYASNNGYGSVCDNDDDSINMMFSDPHDAIRSAFYGDYNPSHAYFTLNGYGNLQSFEYLDDDNSPIHIEELAQWIVDNDSYNDYDIEVTTLDDMLASIEDNITDDEMVLNRVCQYLRLNHIPLGNDCSFDEKVNIVMELINGFNYGQLEKLIKDLNINYQ